MFRQLLNLMPFLIPDGQGAGKTEEEPGADPSLTDVEETQTEPSEDEDSALEQARQKVIEEAESLDPGKTDEEEEEPKEELDETPAEDKTEAKTVKLTDDYINEQPEEHQAILKSLLGKDKEMNLPGRFVKNYVNSQLHIAELKGGSEGGKTPEPEQETQKNFDVQKMSDDEIGTERDNYVFSQLKKSFPDLPDEALGNEEAIEDYLSDLQIDKPLKAEKFKDAYRAINTKASKFEGDLRNLNSNWEGIAKQTIQQDIMQFEKTLKDKYKLDPKKDLGLQYTDDYIINNIIFNQDGTVDPKIVFFRKSIPIIRAGAVKDKMREMYDDKIADIVTNNARREGYTKRELDEPNPSMSNSASTGRSRTDRGDNNVITDDMELEEIDKILAKEKSKILKSV